MKNSFFALLIITNIFNLQSSIFNLQSTAHAQVVLDGSMGTVKQLNGPDYDIKARYGQQKGANLFHSFQTFNINTAESATFSGPASVQNIISRVTGGSLSRIDGKLVSTIPGADLYLLNRGNFRI